LISFVTGRVDAAGDAFDETARGANAFRSEIAACRNCVECAIYGTVRKAWEGLRRAEPHKDADGGDGQNVKLHHDCGRRV